MPRYLLFLLFAFNCTLASADTIRLSEPVQVDDTSETFGEAMAELPELVTIAEIRAAPKDHMTSPLALTARVAKVCQKKGCFFIAQQGSETIRVSFKDYGFFVPTDIGGREITLLGELVAHELSPEKAQHLSNDLGEKGSVKSGQVYEIVARSVRVPR